MADSPRIKFRRGLTSGVVPSGLLEGEIAINLADRYLYAGTTNGTSVLISGGGAGTPGPAGATGATGATGPQGNTGATGAIPTDYVISVNGATGAITNVAKTNTTQTFTGLQQFASGISATGITVDSFGKLVVENIYSHREYDVGSGLVDGGNVSFFADGQISYFAGQGTGTRISPPIISFSNVNVDPDADINFTASGGDINFTAEQNINLVAASGGIVINPVSFVNIAGALLYVDDTNNRIGINVSTSPQFPLDVSGIGNFRSGISAASGITFANTLQVGQTATFLGNISAPNIVNTFNGVTGAVNIVAGSNVTITPSGNTFTISSSTGVVVPGGLTNGYVQYYYNGGFSADDGLQYDSSLENLRIGSGNRHIEIYTSSADSIIEGLGASTLHLQHTQIVTVGDGMGNSNGTKITVSDGSEEINLKGTVSFTDPTSVYTYTFPGTTGSDGEVLTTDGSGTLSWKKPVPDFLLMDMGII